MSNRKLRKASKTWAEALENMKAALAENPMMAHPLMASMQVFEDVGQMIFGGARQSRNSGTKRAKSKGASARKRKRIGVRPGRRTGSSKKA